MALVGAGYCRVLGRFSQKPKRGRFGGCLALLAGTRAGKTAESRPSVPVRIPKGRVDDEVLSSSCKARPCQCLRLCSGVNCLGFAKVGLGGNCGRKITQAADADDTLSRPSAPVRHCTASSAVCANVVECSEINVEPTDTPSSASPRTSSSLHVAQRDTHPLLVCCSRMARYAERQPEVTDDLAIVYFHVSSRFCVIRGLCPGFTITRSPSGSTHSNSHCGTPRPGG